MMILKLSDNDLRSGVALCFNNGESLITDAEVLFKRKSYGHASFLALSAIEEIAKAYFYALHRTEIEKSDELGKDVIRHESKFIVFLFSLLTDSIQRQIEAGRAQITKPLDVDDFADMGKDWDSALGDLWNFRNRNLYVDRVKRRWFSPLDTKRADANSWIDAAKNMVSKFEPLCKSLSSPPIDALKNVQQFLDNQLFPAIIERFRQNADELYKNKIITKKLYDTIQGTTANKK
jgi:AbiV family abortive infection protein